MKIVSAVFVWALLPAVSNAFSVSSVSSSTTQKSSRLSLSANDDIQEQGQEGISRRQVFQTAMTTGVTFAATSSLLFPRMALAEEETTAAAVAAVEEVAAPASNSIIKNVVVAGATGQTGSRIYERLVASGATVTGGVRNVEKAKKNLKTSAPLAHLDVVEDSLDTLVATLQSAQADGLIIACGMNPGKNLLRMSAAAHEVDNLGTCKLIDAAKQAGVKKVVMVSSILTNGRAWGQEKSPGFVATNAFGGALDEKLAAELHLKASGLDYTIVRPGGLKTGNPTGALSVNPEDTLNSGEITRDLVADVCVAALNDAKASNKVLEIIEDEGVPPKVFNGLVM